MNYSHKDIRNVIPLGWFEDKICACPAFKYDLGFDWETEFKKMERPPTCAACDKWADRVQCCRRCQKQYYQFFWHPQMGWEPKQPPGWTCWNCLENGHYRNMGVKVSCTKTPPPAIVIPPGDEFVPRPPRVNRFAAF